MPVSKESQGPKAKAEGRDLGDEYLVYDRPHDRVHVLNGTARDIFVLCDGEHTAEQIAAKLVEKYGVDEATARKDTQKTLEQLAELGAVDWD